MFITKMHGLGNDFILADNEDGSLGDIGTTAKKLCTRRLSVGADGFIAVERSDSCDIRMRIINADGSEAEMCGNGIRCFTKYVYEKGIVDKKEFTVETGAGVMKPKIVSCDPFLVRVDMGMPSFERHDLPMVGKGSSEAAMIEVDGQIMEVGAVLMGVPHVYVSVDSFDGNVVERLGPKIETNSMFPKKTNVNFVKIIDKHTIEMRTWERGAGRTLACGTGSTGMAALLHKKKLVGNEVEVRLYAGSLFIEIDEDGRCFMTGPAETVFNGEATV